MEGDDSRPMFFYLQKNTGHNNLHTTNIYVMPFEDHNAIIGQPKSPQQ